MKKSVNAARLSKSLLNDSLASARADRERMEKRARELRNARHTLMYLVTTLINAIPESLRNNLHGFASTHYGIPMFEMTTSLRVQSFKDDPTLIQALEYLINTQGVDTLESQDYVSSWCAERTYRFALRGNGCEVRLSIEAQLEGDNPTCRKIKVGEEARIVEEYAIVCS